MRILSVSAQKPDSTGSGVFLSELVKGFHKAGHKQAILCGISIEDSVAHLPEQVAVYPVVYKTEELPFPVCGMSDEMPYESTRYCDLSEEMTQQLFAAFRKKIQQAVEEFQPDVILCHHLYFLCALLRQSCPDIPVYGQCHGSDLRQFRKNPWQRDFIRSQIQQLDGIFALHEEQKLHICDAFAVPAEKVTVIGTGYNSDVFSIQEEIKAEKNSDITRLIFAGKLSEKKGVMSLVRSLSYLEQPEKVELVMAGGYGNAAEYTEICRLAQKAPCSVRFLGKLSHQQLARELNASDVFVLPSFYEGLPLVLIEAMACGLRVICTDLPGIQPWLNKAIPGSGVVFVTPPQMRNEDEPLPESLPAFEQRLADAIVAVQKNELADQQQVKSVSWTALCEKLCALFKK
ncbi:MAG: glycosyltransferase [Firmicutes bacterium]|nr:glycosyltransferase [Bacillota bacterium]